MTTSPQEPTENPDVVPSGDPEPISTPDPNNPNEEATAPENLEDLSGPREPDVEEPTIDDNELTDDA